MTKLTGGKAIIVKINGQKRPFHEEQPTIEIETIENNSQETVMLPPPITTNQAHEEAAAAKELHDESFEWILPESDPLQIESSSDFHGQAPKHQPKPWKKHLDGLKPIIFSVIFAVIIGTILGMVMLKLVLKDYGKPAATAKPVSSVIEKELPNGGEKAAPLILKSWTTYVVQGGVYSSKDSAAEAAKQAVKSGIPAEEFEINGQHFLFLGVADSSDNARKLRNMYQNIDGIFAKSITIPEKKLTNISSKEHLFLKDAASLFPILTKSTSSSEFASSNPKELVSSITTLESSIRKIDNKQLQDKKVLELKKEITLASENVKSYLKKKDHDSHTKAQQHLLAFLSIYYSF